MSMWHMHWLVVFVALSVSRTWCASSCPPNCSCEEYVVELNVVCSGNGSKTIPDDLPLDTTYLTLTGFKLPVLDLRVFGGLKKLRGLRLVSDEIAQIEGTLEMFTYLHEVDLSKNKLTSVSPRTFGNTAKSLGLVDLDGNPFHCDAHCGGLLSDSEQCDCSINMFDCICNIEWLKEQVKQRPSVWVGIRCHVPKDADIQNVEIHDYWCKTKWRYLLPIILACVLLTIGLIATLVYKCKKKSRYVHLESLYRHTDQVTEEQLNKLAGKLGKEWESLAIHLGMTKAEVDRIIADNNRNTRVQIFNMLVFWKNEMGEQATVGTLVEQLKSFQLDPEMYEFLDDSSNSD
ncbi:SLIT2 [Branchiostoma lanceolatum]|uniref:SLIT2 protein n=1 Tax=Branchiostoma lanceolatum TaxID=7740 RepID=A0A8J9Z9Y0_BRALA|nr:SLIT2 [Branchiostoma lanceolatum]